MTKVLLVEDEPRVADSIKKWLEEQEYEVTIAPDGAVGRHLGLSEHFDILLIDLNLPFINGYEVCRAVRAVKTEVPIIFLTAMGEVEQKLSGFEVGADDYIVKPFDFRELHLRMKSLLKRSKSTQNDVETHDTLRVADLEMNLADKTVHRGFQKIDLTAKEFALLEFLLRQNGRIASRSEIIEKVWDINFDTGTNVVEVYINFLRKKIDRNFDQKLIHTRQGMGYFIKEI